jgi:hypothetical protein
MISDNHDNKLVGILKLNFVRARILEIALKKGEIFF